MTKPLIKNTRKSDKLVSKATSTFDTAIQTIEKANMLLATQVDAQNSEIYNDTMEISNLESGIKLRKQNIEEMVYKIDSNNEMIEKLSQFASVNQYA